MGREEGGGVHRCRDKPGGGKMGEEGGLSTS